MLHVDGRWRGQHGIGRYATEVIDRLSMPWIPLPLSGSPSSPLDALRPRGVSSDELIYSPGYNAQAGRVRQIITVHDLIHLRVNGPKRLLYRGYYDAVIAPAIKRAGTVFTVSNSSAQAIREWLGSAEPDIIVTGGGCSSAFSVDARTINGPSDASPYAVVVGNLRPHKNLSTAIAALALVPDAHAVLVVPPGEHAALQQLIEADNLQARVRVQSGVSDTELARLYADAAVTVMPSLLEGFGLPALESLRSGTPVVYWAGCDSVAEIVDGHGLAVDSPTDPDPWAVAIARALSTPTRADYPDDRFTWSRASAIVNETLATALASNA